MPQDCSCLRADFFRIFVSGLGEILLTYISLTYKITAYPSACLHPHQHSAILVQPRTTPPSTRGRLRHSVSSMIAAVLAMGLTGGRARCCTTPSLRLARAPSTRLEVREGLDEAAVWQARAICTLCLRGSSTRVLRTIYTLRVMLRMLCTCRTHALSTTSSQALRRPCVYHACGSGMWTS